MEKDNIWISYDQARSVIAEYTEEFYNRQRMHSYLDYQSPVEHEKNYEQKLMKAAQENCPLNRVNSNTRLGAVYVAKSFGKEVPSD